MTLHVELPQRRERERERRLSGSSFEAALGRRMASVRRWGHNCYSDTVYSDDPLTVTVLIVPIWHCTSQMIWLERQPAYNKL